MTHLILSLAAAALVALAALRCQPRRSRRSPFGVDRPAGRLDRFVAALADRRGRSGVPQPRAVADWCDDLARSVRAGVTLRVALATTEPTDPTTRSATQTLRFGLDRGKSITDAVERCERRGPDLDLALRVVATVARLGGMSAVAIDRTAAVLRQRAADRDERDVHAAQARLSGHVLTAIPVLMLALLLMTDPDVRTTTTSPVGALCIGIGITLNGVGWIWMRRLVGDRR